jgi:hypothetical protein
VGGGLEPTITAGPELPDPVSLDVSWLLERAGTLYVRYSAGSHHAQEDRPPG